MTSTRVSAGTAALFVATIAAGLGAGFFLTYSYTIMPGLGTTDDQTFVAAFQGLERVFAGTTAQFNWPVALSFFGGPPLAFLAAVLNWRNRVVLALSSVATLLLLSVILTTLLFNVPSNNMISAAGDPARIDVAAVRAEFDEGAWRAWNQVRSGTSGLAFICLATGLVVSTRSRDDQQVPDAGRRTRGVDSRR